MKRKRTWTVAYLRSAVVENGDFSALQKQKLEVEQYCQKNSLVLKKVFWDVGSGADLTRKGWKELVNYVASSNGAINYILSLDPSRICRNLPLLLLESDQLEKDYKLKFIYCLKANKAIKIKSFLARI